MRLQKKNKSGSSFLTLDTILLIILILLLILYYTSLLPSKHAGQILLAVSLAATLPVVQSSFRSLRKKKISVDLLASIALAASLLAKEWASATFINLMLTSARIFAFYTETKAHSAIESLLKFRPQKIKVRRGEKMVEVKPEKIKIGDLVVIESGDRIPVDGTVESGTAEIDQSSLTGESAPILKVRGDWVFSSTLNLSGSLVISVKKVGRDTTLEKIINLVENAEKNKSNLQTAADKFASWYIVLILISSLIIYWIFRDIYLLLALLLVACADDIAVAVPLAFLAAIGYAARRGVIIKGGNYLEALSQTETFVFDKTGTLTRGKLKVREVRPFGNYEIKEILKMAGAAELFSEHPVAKAIREYVGKQEINLEKIDNFNELPGKGTTVEWQNEKIISGNFKFFQESEIIMLPEEIKQIKELEKEGYTVTLLGRSGCLAGAVLCLDAVRPEARSVMDRLKNLGIRKEVMLTGDNPQIAQKIAMEIGLTNYHAGLSPENKLTCLKKYLNPETKTVMVGDGVNDAAAIALADVGIAMGTIGSDAALDAANITLMKDDLREIPEMMALSLYTRRIARQDFLIWGAVNLVGLFLVFGKLIGTEGAAAYNFFTDFLPLMNSLRLFNLHLKL